MFATSISNTLRSYFHTELDETAKKLIGDIAPKKLETTAPPSDTGSDAGTLGSAWNRAGTWEERDVTAWTLETLPKYLVQVRYDGSIQASVTSSDVKGSASVAMVRGKKRYIYELDIKINWKAESEGDAITGKLHFPDIDGTCKAPYECEFAIDELGCASLRAAVQEHVYRHGLRDAIHKAIDAWVEELQSTF
jgi:hypothetical protein